MPDGTTTGAAATGRRAAAALRGVRAVLLDMDGTLVDSDAAVERAWTRWSAEYGADLAAVLRVAQGRPAAATIRLLAPGLDDAAVELAAARQSELQVEDVAGTVALPGARELLAALDRLGLPWAVVTSADLPLARARLRAAGIAPPLLGSRSPTRGPRRHRDLSPQVREARDRYLTDSLVTVEDVRAGKPDPEGYLTAASRLGVEPGHCLVVEDSAPGIEAGRRAGAVVAALRGLPADLTIRDLAELAVLLERSAVR